MDNHLAAAQVNGICLNKFEQWNTRYQTGQKCEHVGQGLDPLLRCGKTALRMPVKIRGQSTSQLGAMVAEMVVPGSTGSSPSSSLQVVAVLGTLEGQLDLAFMRSRRTNSVEEMMHKLVSQTVTAGNGVSLEKRSLDEHAKKAVMIVNSCVGKDHTEILVMAEMRWAVMKSYDRPPGGFEHHDGADGEGTTMVQRTFLAHGPSHPCVVP